MNNKNAMISQQARSIAASAVIGNSNGKPGKNNKANGNARIREIHQTEGYDRHYSFAFFIAVLISIVGAICLGFLLGVIGIV